MDDTRLWKSRTRTVSLSLSVSEMTKNDVSSLSRLCHTAKICNNHLMVKNYDGYGCLGRTNTNPGSHMFGWWWWCMISISNIKITVLVWIIVDPYRAIQFVQLLGFRHGGFQVVVVPLPRRWPVLARDHQEPDFVTCSFSMGPKEPSGTSRKSRRHAWEIFTSR